MIVKEAAGLTIRSICPQNDLHALEQTYLKIESVKNQQTSIIIGYIFSF